MNYGPDSSQSAENHSHPDDRTAGQKDELPALPGLHAWRTVYWVVLAVFVLYILLMRAFQGFFS